MTRFFEMLPAISSWGTLLILIFFSWQAPAWVAVFIVLYDLYWFLKTLYLFFYLRYSFKTLKVHTAMDWRARLIGEQLKWEHLHHLIILPMYHEPYEVVRETFQDLARTNYPREKMHVVLATEERGGENDIKTAERIAQEFGNIFGGFLVTVHPKDIEGELPGKGSNETYAAREAVRVLIDANHIAYEEVLVSVFDSDTRAGREYFGVLAYHFLTAPHPMRSSYQPVPLFVNRIYSVPLFARLISFSASFWQFMQQARPEQLVTFSSHSMPLKPLIEIGFWHTGMVSEDSRIFFQCFIHYKGDWRAVPLFYPVEMDPVDGTTAWETLKNLYKQQRRWAWGVENIPYVLTSFVKEKGIAFRKKCYWVWLLFDGFHSWATSSFIIFLFGVLPNIIGGEVFTTSVLSYNLPRLTGTLINMSVIGIVTSALLSVILIPPHTRKEPHQPYIYLFYTLQWFLIPITFVMFSAIPALESQTRLMLGGKFRLGFWKTPKRELREAPREA